MIAVSTSRTEQRGIAIIILVLSIVFMMLFVGLAIDGGILYMVKGRLGAAVDSAALAAGRSLNLGTDVASAQTAARTTGLAFFNANFPPNFMGSNPADTVVDSVFTPQMENGRPNGILNVQVTATVRTPIYFMRILNSVFGSNLSHVTITSTGTATRRGLVMMLVLDDSGSMGTGTNNPVTAASSACDVMKDAARNFIANFSPYDTLGLVTFTESATLRYAPSSNWKTGNALRNQISSMTCSGSTNTTAGLHRAYEQIINMVRLPLALNTIVLFTDGMPNGVNGVFPTKRVVDSRFGWSGGPTPCNNTNNLCNAPVACTTNTTITGVITQGSNHNATGTTSGFSRSYNTDAIPTVPPGCPTASSAMRQTVAYIPDEDRWQNSTRGFKDNFLLDSNRYTVPNPPPGLTPAGRRIGRQWLAGVVPDGGRTNTGSNFFPAGHPYAGMLRPDQPNTIGIVGMHTAINEANRIRSNSTYNIAIHSIFLLAKGIDDPVDKYFLPIISNSQIIPPGVVRPTDPEETNPYHDSAQKEGMHLATTNSAQLYALFQELASSLLRLSR